MIFKYFLLVLTFNYISCLDSNNVKVKTSSGLVQGNSLVVLNKTINQFLGIPFAEPPIGSLRFAKPQPLQKPLEGIIDATKPKNSCFQMHSLDDKFGSFVLNLTESEDCLVLNIWSPELPHNETKSSLKPVMFWIHGGGFEIGSIFQLPIYDGRVLATKDVVVVSTNYRLGVFGFLYGGQESAPGNLGHYDQVLALKWVKQNIHLFGGDPNMITIFGESAGSMSVSLLVISPMSRNLFQRAILESGASTLNGGVTKTEALAAAKDFSKSFNCSDNNQWLDCLRKVDAKKINSLNFSPSIAIYGTDFLPLSPHEALKNGNFTKGIQIMAGVTKDEGTLLAYLILPNFNDTVSKTDLLTTMKAMLHPGIDKDMISKFYLSDVDPNNQTALKRGFSAFYGDLIITCPTYLFAEEFAQFSPKDSVYFYEWNYKYKSEGIFACEPEWMGICHGADLGFVFGTPLLMPQSSSEIDQNFSKNIITLWTNFAKTGKPVLDNTTFEWPALRKSAESPVVSRVMELNPHNLGHILNAPFRSNCDGLWKQFLIGV